MANARYGNALQGAASAYRSKRAAMNKNKKHAGGGGKFSNRTLSSDQGRVHKKLPPNFSHKGGGGTFTKAKNATHVGGWSENDVAGHSSRHPRHVGGGGTFSKGGGAENLSRAAWRKAHPVMSAAEDKQGLKGTGGGNFAKGGKNYRWSKAAKAFTVQGGSHVGGGGMFKKAKNATYEGSSRSSGKMSVSGNAYHNGPGAASTGRRDNAGNSTSRSNAFKAGRLRRKFSGEFGGADQIRKFRKPKRLKIHRNPGGIVY